MIIIRTDGSSENRARKISLESAHKIVGGYVEVVHLSEGYLLVDEDARTKREKPPVNEVASRLAGHEILGNAVFLKSLHDLI